MSSRRLTSRRQAVKVGTPPMNCVEFCCSTLVAGRLTTAPAVLNRELWQGHQDMAEVLGEYEKTPARQ
jgi:hypothetical protein